MSPSKEEKDQSGPSAEDHSKARSNGHKSGDLEGKENEWKFKEPYKVHDQNEGFKGL